MLTHCPECQKELSTAATQCPHCGAPVNQGAMAGGAPMGQPVAGPPQSHCLRNCLIGGCVLVVLIGIGFFAATAMVVSKIKSSFTDDPAQVAAIGQSVAPGATTPPGYAAKGVDIDWFGVKAKGVFLTKGVSNAGDSIIGYGALAGKKMNKDDVRATFERALEQQGHSKSGSQQVEKQEEVEFDVGGQPTKVLHTISTDQSGKRLTQYVVVLDDWNNEFGYLGVVGMGLEDKFDLDGFKSVLAGLKRK
jgi:hypothetical protein